MKNLNDMHRHLTVHYGYAENYGKTKADNAADILREGFECLRDYCRDNNVSLVELFEKFDTDSSMSVSLQEFQDGLKVSSSVINNSQDSRLGLKYIFRNFLLFTHGCKFAS